MQPSLPYRVNPLHIATGLDPEPSAIEADSTEQAY